MTSDGYLTSGEWPDRDNKTGALVIKHRVHHGSYGLPIVFAISMMICWAWLFYLLYGTLR
jgi:hypothetical protein